MFPIVEVSEGKPPDNASGPKPEVQLQLRA